MNCTRTWAKKASSVHSAGSSQGEQVDCGVPGAQDPELDSHARVRRSSAPGHSLLLRRAGTVRGADVASSERARSVGGQRAHLHDRESQCRPAYVPGTVEAPLTLLLAVLGGTHQGSEVVRMALQQASPSDLGPPSYAQCPPSVVLATARGKNALAIPAQICYNWTLPALATLQPHMREGYRPAHAARKTPPATS
jgi:hypothetical protein